MHACATACQAFLAVFRALTKRWIGRRWAAAWLSMTAVMTGCGPTPPNGTDGSASLDGALPRVELGTGADSFEEVPDGGDWELVAGPQGGYHLDVSVRLSNLDPDGMTLTYGASSADGAQLTEPIVYAITRRRVIQEDGHFLRFRDRVIFTSTEPADLVGRWVIVHVIAAPEAGESASDARRAMVIDEE